MNAELINQLGTYVIAHSSELVGFTLPVFVDIMNRRVSKDQETLRFLISFLICLVTATFLKWSSLQAGNPEELFSTLALIFTESQVTYRLYFKNSALRQGMNKTFAIVEGFSLIEKIKAISASDKKPAVDEDVVVG